jgi:hypothetical protein
MKLENDPRVKTLPTQRMRDRLADFVVRENRELAAKANQGA